MSIPPEIIVATENAIDALVGLRLDMLQIPRLLLQGFEPSQVGTAVGTLVDASAPALHTLYPQRLAQLGLTKAPGILGEREGYPDFEHASGARLELKMLYKDPVGVTMKAPPTRREPSARLTQKVTLRNVQPDRDLLLVLAYQLQSRDDDPDTFSPVFTNYGLFPAIECVRARDQRLVESGGRWFGDYETPAILSRRGRRKIAEGLTLTLEYGRKESEGKDYNEDTNFGKLKRIPYRPLQEFLMDNGCDYSANGTYPTRWTLQRRNAPRRRATRNLT